MKRLTAVFAVVATVAILAFSTQSDATTSYSSSTWTTENNKQVVTITSTTSSEAAPTSATDGVAIRSDVTLVVTAKAHIVVTADDAGVYDPTGAADATTTAADNTFGPDGVLRCYVYDARAATWARYVAGDIEVVEGGTHMTAKVPALPAVDRVAYVPYSTNVPTIVYLSER